MNIQTLSEQQLARFGRNTKKVIDSLDTTITKIISEYIAIDGILETDKNLTKALLIKKQLAEALKESGFYELSSQALKENKKLMDLQINNLKKLLGRKRLGKIDTKTMRGLLNLDYQGMTGLGEQAIASISNAITQSVVLGTPMADLLENIKGQLGKFEGYANTYMRTTKREFIQKVEDNTAELIKFGEKKDDIWEYIGAPLQHNSREICIHILSVRATPYFTQAMRDEFDTGNFEGVSFDVRRFNCQHNFMITNLTYKEAFGG